MMHEQDYLVGHFLIAMPSMGDPRFEHTVIYLCAHDDRRAMGITLNKPAENVTLQALFEELGISAKDQARFEDRSVLMGGPVEPQRGFVLHTADYAAPTGTLMIGDDIRMTATHDVLRAIASSDAPKRAVVALGYAGWGPGQLEQELQANAWLHCPADQDILFDADHETKWSRALASLGVTTAMLSPEWATPRGDDARAH